MFRSKLEAEDVRKLQFILADETKIFDEKFVG